MSCCRFAGNWKIEEMIKSLVDHGYVTDFETLKKNLSATLLPLVWVTELLCRTARTLLSKEATRFSLLSQTRVLTLKVWIDLTDTLLLDCSSEGANDTHLAALAGVSPILDGFCDKLRKVSSPDEGYHSLWPSIWRQKSLQLFLPAWMVTSS